MKLYLKIIYSIMAIMILTTFSVPSASAKAPYDGYNYSYWKKAEPLPFHMCQI